MARRPVLGFLGLFPVAFSSGAPYLARIERSGPPPVRRGSPACGTPRPRPSCPSRHRTRCPSAARGTPPLGPRVGPSHSPAGSSGTPGHLLGAAHSHPSAVDIPRPLLPSLTPSLPCLPPGIFPDSPLPTPPAQERGAGATAVTQTVTSRNHVGGYCRLSASFSPPLILIEFIFFLFRLLFTLTII